MKKTTLLIFLLNAFTLSAQYIGGLQPITVSCPNTSCVFNQQCENFMFTVTQNNVSCTGGNDGAISVVPTAGTAPFTYIWSTGDRTNSISNLTKGQYLVVVTDAEGCDDNVFITITEPMLLQSNCTSMGTMTNTGSIDLSVSGGIAPYTYLWSNGATTQDINGLTGGIYTVTITDNNGCQIIRDCEVMMTDCPMIDITANVTQPACNILNTGTPTTGAIDITVTGGAAPFNYSWSNGATTQDITNLSAGIYTVTVTDNNGCIEQNGYVIESIDPILLDCESTAETNAAGGTIDITATGGTLPYTYLWSNGATTANLTGLVAGNYSLTLTDANGCEETLTCSVASLRCPNITVSFSSTNETCDGANDGTAAATASGGATPYTYVWSNGATTQNVNALAPNTYTVTVTDANGCTGVDGITITASTVCCMLGMPCDDNDNCTINDQYDNSCNCIGTPSSTQAGTACNDFNDCTINDVYLADCMTCQGTLVDCATAGQTVTIACDDGDDCTDNDTETRLICDNSVCVPCAGTPNNLAGTACDDGDACTDNDVYLADCVTCQGTFTLTNTGNVSQPACHRSNAVINTTTTGGTAPYTYAWSTGATTEDISGDEAVLPNGNYTVTVTDANGCTVVETYNIIRVPEIAFDYTITNASCNTASDGSITISNQVGGYGAPYTCISNFPNTNCVITGLSPGNFVVLNVQDVAGCAFAITIVFPSPDIPCGDPCEGFVASSTTTPTTCNDNNTIDGGIDLTVTGGTAPYIYAWSNSATTEDLTNVSAGDYTVTITDNASCQLIETYTVYDNANCPNPCDNTTITVSTNVTNETCTGDNDGSATATASGGATPYAYSWSNGATGANLTGVTAGTYTVTVTDDNNCEETASVTINTTNNPAICDPCFSSGLGINLLSNVESCNGQSTGQLVVDGTGGTAPYTYAWSNGSTGNVQVNLVGDYTVTVTDNAGCTAVETYNVPQLSPLTSLYSVTIPSCDTDTDGAIDLSPFGSQGNLSNGNYTYNWSNGATTQDLTGIAAGMYTVTVTEQIYTCQEILTINVGTPNLVCCDLENIDITPTITCADAPNGGTVSLAVSGGTPTYTVTWNDGVMGNSRVHSGGNYSVTVTDANGCTKDTSYTLDCCYPVSVIRECDSAPIEGARVFVGGVFLGTTDANGEYLIDTCIGATSKVSILTPNDATNGVDGSDLQAIREHILGINTITGINDLIAADINGSGSITSYDAFLARQGTISPSWSMLVASNFPTALATSYDTDATLSESFNFRGIKIGDLDCMANTVLCECTTTITATASVTNDINNNSGGAINVTPSPTGTYFYTWYDNQTGNYYDTQDLTGIPAGTYDLYINDGCGCSFDLTGIVVGGGTCEPIAIDGNFTGSCSEDQVDLDITVTGGMMPYTYAWSDGMSTEDLSNVDAATDYTVTVTDSDGCIEIANFNNGLTCECNPMSLAFDFDEACTFKTIDGNVVFVNNGAIDMTVSGGFPPYTYHWTATDNYNNIMFDAVTQDIEGLNEFTQYNITVTDNLGCTVSESVFVPNRQTIVDFTKTDISCIGAMDGAIELLNTSNNIPFSIVWSNGATTNNLSNLAAGEYRATITNDFGCQVFRRITIEEPAAIARLVPAITDVQCNGTLGAIDLEYFGGTAPLTYLWSNGATTEDLSNLGAGDYTLTVTDANNCTRVDNYTVLPSGFIIECGTTNVTVNGGSGNYTYNWSNGSMTSAIPSGGAYTVTVTDTNDGCQQVVTCSNCVMPVGTPCDDGDNCTVNDVILDNCQCKGTEQSQAGEACDDGNPNTYYDKIVSDANCNYTCQGTPCDMNLSLLGVSDCDNNTAAIITTITGNNIAPYTYNWSNGATGANLTGVGLSGTYTVTVTDAVGCQVVESITIDYSCTPEEFCELNISSAGGGAGYSYSTTANDNGTAAVQWNPYDLPDGLEIKVNGMTQINICHSNLGWNESYCNAPATNGNKLPELEYFSWSSGDLIEIDVTPNCGSGCNNGGATIWDLAINCVDYEGQLAVDIMVSCENLDFQKPIRVMPTGGTPPYTMEWLTGAQAGYIWTFDPTQPISNIGTGNYIANFAGCDSSNRTVKVTDANGLTVEKTLLGADIPCTNDGDWDKWNNIHPSYCN